MEIVSRSKFVKTTPDKARILAKLIKGKNPQVAITQLQFSNREAAKYLVINIKQALDRIKVKGLNADDFKVSRFEVNEGPKLKRRRIRQQGRATAILKRMAHLTIVLSDGLQDKNIEGKNGTKS